MFGMFGSRKWILMASLCVSAAQAVVLPEGEAPRPADQKEGHWSSGIKQFFGTAYEAYDSRGEYSSASSTAPLSKVWFTGAHGILTETYWPSIDRAQVRDSQFLVSDGKSFLFEERRDAITDVQWVRPGVPVYIIRNKDPKNRFSIEKTIFTDPSRNVLLMKVRIVRNVDGLQFYYLHSPSVGNALMGNTALVNNSNVPGFYAWRGKEAQAVVFSVPMKQVSAGFVDSSDGYQDLIQDYAFDSRFESAENGNVAMTGALDIPRSAGVSEFTIALAFGSHYEEARTLAVAAMDEKEMARAQANYIFEWETYQASLRDFSAASLDGGKLFRASLAILKSSEDKTHAGAFVASPTIPWGLHRPDNTGYHMVWPRDLYQIATSLLSVGDSDSARACLSHLRLIQFNGSEPDWDYGTRKMSRNGAFLQNGWMDGTPNWDGLQMDQTSYPLLLTYRLWKAGKINLADYGDMLIRAGRFIQLNGPWSAQERWEENQGVSPSTVASEIAALWTSAEMAQELGFTEDAAKFKSSADSWSSKPGDNLEAWTFTETGRLGNGKYYERVEGAATPDQTWDPNDGTYFEIKNTKGQLWVLEKDVIDGGFLELVRLGVRKATDYHVLETLHEYDQYLRVNTSKGPGFYRYLGDFYNYDDSSGKQTRGMLWPILTGERAHYELALAIESQASGESMDGSVIPYLAAMENFASASYIIPEQVWDAGPAEGLSTGAATPLGWSHAEYIKLLASRTEKRVVDLIPSVAERSLWLSRRSRLINEQQPSGSKKPIAPDREADHN